MRRELVVFRYSADRLFKRNINLIWVEQLSHDMESAGILEAFGGRFSRVQDTIGDKPIPRALAMLAETPRSALDNLNRAERLGWLDNVEAWLVARELRNRLVHEYITNAKQYLDMFQKTYDRLLSLAKKHCGVSESDLVKYLRGI